MIISRQYLFDYEWLQRVVFYSFCSCIQDCRMLLNPPLNLANRQKPSWLTTCLEIKKDSPLAGWSNPSFPFFQQDFYLEWKKSCCGDFWLLLLSQNSEHDIDLDSAISLLVLTDILSDPDWLTDSMLIPMLRLLTARIFSFIIIMIVISTIGSNQPHVSPSCLPSACCFNY